MTSPYNAEHRRQRRQMIAEHGSKCWQCKGWDPRIQLAHLCHDTRCRRHLALLCRHCHPSHDAPRRYAICRRRRAELAGQQWMWDEVRLMAYPVDTWPNKLRQMTLEGFA